jgi:2'-5' RNA ligase
MPDRAGLKPARLFLALWPAPPVGKRLAEEGQHLHGILGGRLTRTETIHLTLVFIGDLARDRIPTLLDRLAALAATDFTLEFDRADCWRHNRIAYLSPSEPPTPLYELVAKLEAALVELAIPFDRRPYKPHVTVLRKADCAKGNPAAGRVLASPEWGVFRPISWSARSFVLVESVPTPDGVRYDRLGSYALL